MRLSVMPVLVTEARATLRFKVSDTGPGIPEHVRSSVFDPFVQADESTTRRYGGTGLGLAICKRLVELMGGQIGFTTREGQGTEFWFTVDFDLPGPHGGLTGDLQDRARDESRPQVAAPLLRWRYCGYSRLLQRRRRRSGTKPGCVHSGGRRHTPQ